MSDKDNELHELLEADIEGLINFRDLGNSTKADEQQ